MTDTSLKSGLANLAGWLAAFWRDDRAEILRGLAIVVVVIGLAGQGDSAGPWQRQAAADPNFKLAREIGGDLTPRGLRLITLTMSPYAEVVSERLTIHGPEWTPGGPMGWPDYNLARIPNLLRSNLTFDEAREFNNLLPVFDLPVEAMKPFVLPAKNTAERARAELCLSQAVYYEAGFESGEGQAAVAQVVLNRLRHPAYPKSVCGVVYQGSQRPTGCQFSFTCDGSLTRAPAPAAWANAQFVARRALSGFVDPSVGAATHYHADYVVPYWAVTLMKLRQIGAHIFYRMTGPVGGLAAFDGRYEGNETALSADILTGGDARTPDAPSIKPADAPLPEAALPKTVTLTIGGETKTYLVGAPGSLTPPPVVGPVAPGQPQLNIPASVPFAGTLNPTRRRPTPAEIADINEKLREREEEQKSAKQGPVLGPVN